MRRRSRPIPTGRRGPATAPRFATPLFVTLLAALLGACGGAPLRSPPDDVTPAAGTGSSPVATTPDPGASAPPAPVPDAASAAMPDAAPEPAADTAPDAVPDTAPDVAGDPTVREPRPGGGRIGVAALRETSGLAVSRRDPAVLWALNDGGNAAALYALARDGRPLARYSVEAVNRDWEDLAAFRLDGEPHLLVADTGDNGRRRDEVVLHLIAEPALGALAGAPLVPARTLRFRYEDGAHDVEAVAVDETTRTVWLLTKEPVRDGRGAAPGAYALSLDDPPPLLARRRATLADVPRGLVGGLAMSLAGVDLEQPTAFDMSADARVACLLTYRRLRCFRRGDGESWDETLARPGRELRAHDLDQAEAMALSTDGATLWFTSEGLLPPLRQRALAPD